MRRFIIALVSLAAIIFSFAACSKSGLVFLNPELENEGTMVVRKGRLFSVLYDCKSRVSWSSSDEAIVKIEGSHFLAQGEGTARITGSWGRNSKSFYVKVYSVEAYSCECEESYKMLVNNQRDVDLTVKAKDASGNEVSDASPLDMKWTPSSGIRVTPTAAGLNLESAMVGTHTVKGFSQAGVELCSFSVNVKAGISLANSYWVVVEAENIKEIEGSSICFDDPLYATIVSVYLGGKPVSIKGCEYDYLPPNVTIKVNENLLRGVIEGDRLRLTDAQGKQLVYKKR